MDPHNPLSAQDMQMEETFTCTASDSGTTTDDLAGPGRGLDKLFGYVGRRLELLLGKASVKIGKGPIATAQRIHRNRAIVNAVIHSRYCYCNICQFRDAPGMRSEGGSICSPAKLRRLVRQINKDCKRLVGYVECVPSYCHYACCSIFKLVRVSRRRRSKLSTLFWVYPSGTARFEPC